MNFGLIAFKKYNRTFMRDALQLFKDMFEKYGIQSVEWKCYADNKEGINLYRHLLKDYGGYEVGYLRAAGVIQNRQTCDIIIFEILRQDLCMNEGKLYSKKEWNKLMEETNANRDRLRQCSCQHN